MMGNTKRVAAVVLLLVLALSGACASVSFSSFTGMARFFEMSFSKRGSGGISVDGLKAGFNALVDYEGNQFTLEANAQKAADNQFSVMTFSASFHREAELSDIFTLYMESGVESHLILSDCVSTELGLVCKGGAAVQTTENMKVCVSAGLSDMFYSTAVSNIYGNASGNVGMIGMNAQVECSYSF